MSKVQILRRWLLLAGLAFWATSWPELFLACVPMLMMPPLFQTPCVICSGATPTAYQVTWTGLTNGTCSNCSKWNITTVTLNYSIAVYDCCYEATPSDTDACGAGNTLFTMKDARSGFGGFPRFGYYLATIRSYCDGLGDATGVYAISSELSGPPLNTPYDCTQTVNSGWTFTSNDGGCLTVGAGLTVTAL